MVLWLSLPPHSKKLLGLNLLANWGIPMLLWVSSGYFGFHPQSKDMQFKLTGLSRLPVGVNCDNPAIDLNWQGVSCILPKFSWEWLQLSHDPNRSAVEIMYAQTMSSLILAEKILRSWFLWVPERSNRGKESVHYHIEVRIPPSCYLQPGVQERKPGCALRNGGMAYPLFPLNDSDINQSWTDSDFRPFPSVLRCTGHCHIGNRVKINRKSVSI